MNLVRVNRLTKSNLDELQTVIEAALYLNIDVLAQFEPWSIRLKLIKETYTYRDVRNYRDLQNKIPLTINRLADMAKRASLQLEMILDNKLEYIDTIIERRDLIKLLASLYRGDIIPTLLTEMSEIKSVDITPTRKDTKFVINKGKDEIYVGDRVISTEEYIRRCLKMNIPYKVIRGAEVLDIQDNYLIIMYKDERIKFPANYVTKVKPYTHSNN